jgi:hypothetical protein
MLQSVSISRLITTLAIIDACVPRGVGVYGAIINNVIISVTYSTSMTHKDVTHTSFALLSCSSS